MKKLTKVIMSGAAVAALSCTMAFGLAGCGGGLEINITGSTSMQEVMGVLADRFATKYESENGQSVTINVGGGGSGVGIEDAQEGKNDIGMASRALEEDEAATLESTNICLDGIAVVVNPECGLDNVTQAQLKALYEEGTPIEYMSGTTTKSIIAALSREEGSGTRDGFEDIVKIEKLYTGTGFTVHGSTDEVKTQIADNEDGTKLGYISLGAVDSTVKAVKYEGVEASEANILSDDYKLYRPFVICYQSYDGLSDIAKEFVDFIMSDEGQQILEEEGYVSQELNK